MSKLTIVPSDVQLAAKRGFVRTTAQAASTALAGGVTSAGVLQVVNGEVPLGPALVIAGVAVVSPFIAGLASYFSILAKGIPADYV